MKLASRNSLGRSTLEAGFRQPVLSPVCVFRSPVIEAGGLQRHTLSVLCG
jgi:hypothetical protein